MYLKQKYIRTEDDHIIVFPELIPHSRFRMFNPKSAGFVQIRTTPSWELVADVYGESVSLELRPGATDKDLIERQILTKF